jgi:hypothetical protein
LSEIPLLESESEIEVAGLYFHAVRQFGKSLGHAVDAKFQSKNAPDWFSIIKEARQKEKAPVYDDPFDPRFLIKEAVIPKSPVAMAIPGFGTDWREIAFKLRYQINKWSHFAVAPTVENLILVFETLYKASTLSNLKIAQDFQASLERLRQIESGVWTPKLDGKTDIIRDSEVNSFTQKFSAKIDAIETRPPVGSVWTGAKGTRKIVIHKALNDVTENGVSIKTSLLPNADEVLTRWLRYYPMGGEAKVAPDGAVMGFRKGTPYLIGWLGVQQEEVPEPQGFFLDHEFEFIGTDIRDVQTGILLSKVSPEPIEWLLDELATGMPIDSVFNVTTYGQIVFEDETGEIRKVSNIHKDVWFPGQLPG